MGRIQQISKKLCAISGFWVPFLKYTKTLGKKKENKIQFKNTFKPLGRTFTTAEKKKNSFVLHKRYDQNKNHVVFGARLPVICISFTLITFKQYNF